MNTRMTAIAIVWMLLTGCAGSQIDILTNYDQAFDFSNRRTYKWMDTPPGQIFPVETRDPAELDARIKAVADEELKYKGFQLSDNPDFVLTYLVQVVERVQANDSPSMTSWDPSDDPTKYGQAVLALDFLDAATNTRVWRGGALTDIRAGEGRKKVQAVVTKILEEFPPKK